MKDSATTEAIEIVGTNLAQASSATAKALRELGEQELIGDERTYALVPLGIEVAVGLDGTVISAHLHSAGREEFGQFPLDFQGLSFASDRHCVLSKLGSPITSGTGHDGPWVSYRFDGRHLHFLFDAKSNLVRLVTISQC